MSWWGMGHNTPTPTQAKSELDQASQNYLDSFPAVLNVKMTNNLYSYHLSSCLVGVSSNEYDTYFSETNANTVMPV